MKTILAGFRQFMLCMLVGLCMAVVSAPARSASEVVELDSRAVISKLGEGLTASRTRCTRTSFAWALAHRLRHSQRRRKASCTPSPRDPYWRAFTAGQKPAARPRATGSWLFSTETPRLDPPRWPQTRTSRACELASPQTRWMCPSTPSASCTLARLIGRSCLLDSAHAA